VTEIDQQHKKLILKSGEEIIKRGRSAYHE